MAERKQILVACGSAVATATVVAHTLSWELQRRGISAVVDECKAAEVPDRVDGHDLVVTTSYVGETNGVPVIQAVSLLTGIGVERDMDRIANALRE